MPPRRAPFLLRAEGGAAGGLIGAVAVAVMFFINGAIHLTPLAVPSALTSAWFAGTSAGSSAPTGLSLNLVVVLNLLVYTALHLVTFAIVGVSATFVVEGSRFWKSVCTGAIYAGVVCTGLLYVVGSVRNTPVALEVLGLHRVLLANMLAGAMIGGALYVVEHGAEHDVAV
ncbi:MAG: hypothetical protein ABI542_11580 [Gemmatimonadota bacterium]